MNFKKFFLKIPIWLRFGIIGITIRSLLYLVSYDGLLGWLKHIDFVAIFFCHEKCIGWDSLIHIITIWPSIFIIGCFIGFIVDRIQSRTKSFLVVLGISITIFAIIFIRANAPNELKMAQGFNVINNKAYLRINGSFDTKQKTIQIKEADVDSIKNLDYGYAADKNQVYMLQCPFSSQKDIPYVIFSNDPHNFEVLSPMYSKDSQNVYMWGRIIENADVETFEVIKNIDMTSGKAKSILSDRAKDKNYYYNKGEIVGKIPSL